MIDGNTQLVGLLGWPVGHSLSPIMHNAAFEVLGLNWRYVALPVHPDRVLEAVGGLVALGFCGANVTVPHKQSVMRAMDDLEQTADLLNAVNTIVIHRDDERKSTTIGYNTDVQGFIRALREGGFDPAGGGGAVVLGAGGAARAVVYGLMSSGVKEVRVFNRTLENGQALVTHFRSLVRPGNCLQALPLDEDILVDAVRRADLLVNTTTVGMTPNVNDMVWPENVPMPSNLTVFDLVYNPLETRLLKQARQTGANAVDGLGMLIWQGALAFEMWTGRPAPVEVMRAACMDHWRREAC
ncbi:MAG: shikimate dehydrogenase [Anaerolineales bacterium]|nr:shikimate dehydrogenase [Anaerolineales bacterium]